MLHASTPICKHRSTARVTAENRETLWTFFGAFNLCKWFCAHVIPMLSYVQQEVLRRRNYEHLGLASDSGSVCRQSLTTSSGMATGQGLPVLAVLIILDDMGSHRPTNIEKQILPPHTCKCRLPRNTRS